MATNEVNSQGDNLRATVGSGVVSGDPVMIGTLPAVAQTSYAAADGKATVRTTGVDTLSVKGANDAGNVAIAAGDPVFYVSGDTPVLSAKRSGLFYGHALEAVSSGATTSIKVRLGRTAGPGRANLGLFISTEQTGTGSAQSIAHGLGIVPSVVFAVPTDLTASTVGAYAAVQGTHTSTNVVITVTSGKKYLIIALL